MKEKTWLISHQPICFYPHLSIVYFIHFIITIADEQQLYTVHIQLAQTDIFHSLLHMTANKTGIINSLPLSPMTRGRGLRKEIYSNDLPPTFIHLWLCCSSFSQILVSRPPECVPKETQRLQRYSSRGLLLSLCSVAWALSHNTHAENIYSWCFWQIRAFDYTTDWFKLQLYSF